MQACDGLPTHAHKPLLSPWSASRTKRLFDIAAVVLSAPFAVTFAVAVSAALFLSSNEPVLFRQARVGRNGDLFWILKFRTMRGDPKFDEAMPEHITRLGRFLRWSKLDELPQLLNILRGEMSLVGPRPKVREQSTRVFACRPGLTGAATLAFVQEPALLESIPRENVSEYYNRVLLPQKCRMDEIYMASATFVSDLRILVATAVNLWNADRGIRRQQNREAQPVVNHAGLSSSGRQPGMPVAQPES
jgi:lipopolysaccharide/colanic/teichoic acid biosynthesis glycosyltransferase